MAAILSLLINKRGQKQEGSRAYARGWG